MDSSEPLDLGDEPFDRRADLMEQRALCKRTMRAHSLDPRVVASTSKELREINRELDAMPDPVKVTSLDDARAEYARLVAVADLPAQATGTD